jgi:hypothetical protein
MATRKRTSKKGAKEETPKGKDEWDADEEAVFAAFGVGPGDLALRRFIRGQRQINGRFYTVIGTILDHLKSQSKAANPVVNFALKHADDLNEGVPGPPPGCDDKGLAGTGGNT